MRIEAQLDLITKLHRVVAILGIVAILGLAGMGVFTSTQVAATKFQKSQADGQVKTIQAALPAKIDDHPKPVDGSEAIISFQSKLQQAANERGVLVEFESTGDPAIFMTRFANTGAEGEWKQSELQLSIVGTTRQALDLLTAVTSFNVPFEFGDMEIQATQALDQEAVVTIRTQIRVLYRSE